MYKFTVQKTKQNKTMQKQAVIPVGLGQLFNILDSISEISGENKSHHIWPVYKHDLLFS